MNNTGIKDFGKYMVLILQQEFQNPLLACEVFGMQKYHLVKSLVVYFSRKHHPYLKYIMPAASLFTIEISNFPKRLFGTTVVSFL